MGVKDIIKNWFTEEDDPEEQYPDGNEGYTKDYQDDEEHNRRNADYCLFVEKPTRFEEAQRLANQLKAGNVIVISLAELPKEEIRRLIDFLSGVVLSKNGMIKKISQDIIICTPANIRMVSDR